MEHDDLEALFEATRAQAEQAARPPAAPRVPPGTDGPAPSPQAVAAAADAVARARAPDEAVAPASVARIVRALEADGVDACPNADPDGVCRQCTCGSARALRDRVGRLTRELHESLKELRLDRTLADMAVEIPDARNRLKYVTEMCERSAQKVLDTLDELSPMQRSQRDESAALLERWDRLLRERRRPDDGYMALFAGTREHLAASVQRAERSASLHSDIMMAQDFQDLTGQVCRKIEGITERIETQLIALLIDTAPEDHRARHTEMLEGPQVVAGRDDAVTSQGEVDDLLASLGF